MPSHRRMRAFDRDLIRGGHYGQRSCETALKGRTHGSTDQACDVKISLANPEPSTHGTFETCSLAANKSVYRVPAQPVDATQALNLSAGVSNCKVSRGRSFS